MKTLKDTLQFLLITNVQARSLVKKETSWTYITILADAECSNPFALKLKAPRPMTKAVISEIAILKSLEIIHRYIPHAILQPQYYTTRYNCSQMMR